MDYTVVTDDEISELIKQVKELIADGWKPQGGISVTLSESDNYRYIFYAQALTKKNSEPITASFTVSSQAPATLMGLPVVQCDDLSELNPDDIVFGSFNDYDRRASCPT